MFWRPRPKVIDHATTPVRRRSSPDVSLTGLIYVAMMLFMGVAAINTQANLLFGVFGLMVGVVMISWFLSSWVLRRLELRRQLPDHAVVGQPTHVVYEFHNRKRYWPSLSVTVSELDGVEALVAQPQGYLLHAAAGMTASVPVQIVPKRRGVCRLGSHQLSTSFPFGFVKRAVDRKQADELLVYPAIAQVDARLLQLCRSAERVGPSVRPRRGGQDEFFGLREYRTGESPRLIHWKRSARTGTLVSRDMTHVSPPRLMLLVDTHLPDRSPAAHADVEICIAMAASLAAFALETELPVGLACRTDQWIVVPAQRGRRQRRDLLALLASLPANTDHKAPDLLAAAASELSAGVSPVLFTASSAFANAGASSLLTIRPHTPEARGWFKFDPRIEFAYSMPYDQQPGRPATNPRRRASIDGNGR